MMTTKKSSKLSYIDLFCGMGSFHYSFRKLGWECRMACDNNPSAKATYEKNYSLKPRGDVTTIEPSETPPFDILCAGFPCQPFSQCGQRKGFEDERGSMFFQVMKFVTFHRPPILILENVPALLSHDHGNTFLRMKTELEKEEYDVVHKIMKCSDYGVPQMRKRLFILAIKKRSEKIHNDSKNSIKDLLDFHEYEKEISLSEYLGKPFERNCAYTIRCGGRHSPMGDRHNWDGYVVNGEEYRLSLEDALRLQGFDSDFNLCGTLSDKWKQLGNTIPTVFTEMIGRKISTCFENI